MNYKVNVKLTDTQVKKLRIAVKNNTGTTLRMSLKMFDGNDLPHELLLTIRQQTKLRNAFNNNMSTDIKLSKAQKSKIIQTGGFLGLPLSKLAGPLMKVAVLLAKKLLAPLGVTAASLAIDAGIKKTKKQTNKHVSGTTTLIISKEEKMTMKIVQALEDSNVLLKEVTETIKNETRKQRWGFLGTIVGTLGSILLGNSLSEKEIVRAGSENKGRGIVRAGYGKEWDF